MSRITNDLVEIGEMAHHGPEDLFIAIMTLIGAFVLMSSIHWKLALLIFAVIPVLIWVSIYFNKKMTKAFDTMYTSMGEFNARVENIIGGIRVVQAFGNEQFEKVRFDKNNNRFRGANHLRGDIRYSDVPFGYEGKDKVLKRN